MNGATRAAIWCRVSTTEQTVDNQLFALRQEATRRGWQIVRVFDVTASGYKGEQEAMLTELVRGAQRKDYSVVLCWALDRLDRRGIASTLGIVHRIMDTGCRLISLKESWLEVDGPARELLLGVVAWCGQQESARRSERVKAGLQRRKAMGLPIGRKPGALDRNRRKRTGYLLRYAQTS